jgi:hypothetical protein
MPLSQTIGLLTQKGLASMASEIRKQAAKGEPPDRTASPFTSREQTQGRSQHCLHVALLEVGEGETYQEGVCRAKFGFQAVCKSYR